jgi:hypothetical protein
VVVIAFAPIFEKTTPRIIPLVPSPSKTPDPPKIDPAPLKVIEAPVVVPTAKFAYPLLIKFPPRVVGVPVAPPTAEVYAKYLPPGLIVMFPPIVTGNVVAPHCKVPFTFNSAYAIGWSMVTTEPAAIVTKLPPAGTTPPTHVAGEDHCPPIAEDVKSAGAAELKLILSIATPGDVPNEASFCQVKIKRKVVPAKDEGIVTAAFV